MKKDTDIILAFPVNQNQQEFLLGIFTIEQILTFTKYTNRILMGFDENDKPIHNNQIQRMIENARVQKIADFLINDKEATFPTNIVLHIPQQAIDSYETKSIQGMEYVTIKLSNQVFEGVRQERAIPESGTIYISIIDGQHRIRGIEIAIQRLEQDIKVAKGLVYSGSKDLKWQQKIEYYLQRLKDLKNIQLSVSFFIAKTIEYQAMIFSTINRTQKRVTDNLVYDLFGLTLNDSPQKSALQIVTALNRHEKSPFFNRIKFYGASYEKGNIPPLSEATMVKSIIDFICENAREAENDRYRERSELKYTKMKNNKFLPFRKYYASNEDTKISDILFFFFSGVRDCFFDKNGNSLWPLSDYSSKPTNVLQTTIGYLSFLDILMDIIKQNKNEADLFDKKYYQEFLKKASGLEFSDLNKFPLTSKTRNLLYYETSLKIFPPNSNNDERIIKLMELRKIG